MARGRERPRTFPLETSTFSLLTLSLSHLHCSTIAFFVGFSLAGAMSAVYLSNDFQASSEVLERKIGDLQAATDKVRSTSLVRSQAIAFCVHPCGVVDLVYSRVPYRRWSCIVDDLNTLSH